MSGNTLGKALIVIIIILLLIYLFIVAWNNIVSTEFHIKIPGLIKFTKWLGITFNPAEQFTQTQNKDTYDTYPGASLCGDLIDIIKVKNIDQAKEKCKVLGANMFSLNENGQCRILKCNSSNIQTNTNDSNSITCVLV
jgi:hypothetical protein